MEKNYDKGEKGGYAFGYKKDQKVCHLFSCFLNDLTAVLFSPSVFSADHYFGPLDLWTALTLTLTLTELSV